MKSLIFVSILLLTSHAFATDARPSFPTLEDNSGVGFPLSKSAVGDSVSGKVGSVSFSFIDGSNLLTIPQLGQKVMASSIPVVISSDQSAVPITGTITASNPSVGPNATPAPSQSTQIGGQDAGGKLQAVKVDASSNLLVSVANTATVVANQGAANTVANGWYVRFSDGSNTPSTFPVLSNSQSSVGSVGTVIDTFSLAAGWDHVNTTNKEIRVDGQGRTEVDLFDGGGTALTSTLVSAKQSLDVNVSQSALPSGAATSANQTTANSSLSSIDGKLNSLGQKTMSASVPVVIASDQSNVPTSAQGKTSVNLARNVYSTTNVTTSAYVQLIASTADTTNAIYTFDSSGQTLVLAVGNSGSEVDKTYIVPGGDDYVPLSIPSGSRVSIKAVSATANSGEFDLVLLK